MHGTADRAVPLSQSEKLQAAYESAGATTHYVPVPGGEHGFAGMDPDELTRPVLEFLREHLNP